MSLQSEADGFKARIAAATKRPALDYDEVQALILTKTLPKAFTIVYVARRFGGEARLDGSRGTNLRRLVTSVVADSVVSARLLEDRIHGEFAFSDVAYESGGGAYTNDEGLYTDLTYWTYVTA